MEELKLCPCCGGLAHIMRENRTISTVNGEVLEYAHVECCDCGIRGSTIQYKKFHAGGWKNGEDNTEEIKKAVRQWNRRVKIKEKVKPVWEPEKKTNGIKMFSFCPVCGNLLNTVDVNGELFGDNFCSKCGAAIKWDGEEEVQPDDL